MDELFRSDNVVVRRVPADDTTRWVVTFDHYGIGHGFDRPGFGESFFRSRGVSAIHVMGCREDWYQYPEMISAMTAVRAAVAGADRVMTYGTSMGAYAAIRFADAAGANAALALSPQYSIDPVKAPHDRRWAQDSYRIRWLADIEGPIRCQFKPVVVYDPSTLDRWHADRIASDIAVTPIRLPYASHPAATFLGEVGMLEGLIFDVLNGTEDVKAIKRQSRALRTTSGTYLSELAARQPPQRFRTAISLARRAGMVAPDEAIPKVALANLLTSVGEHEEALALHRELYVRNKSSVDIVLHYANALLAAGREEQAARMAADVVAIAPHLANLQAWAADMFWATGDRERADIYLAAARELDPHNRDYDVMRQKFDQPDAGAKDRMPMSWKRTKRWLSKSRRRRQVGGGLLT